MLRVHCFKSTVFSTRTFAFAAACPWNSPLVEICSSDKITSFNSLVMTYEFNINIL